MRIINHWPLRFSILTASIAFARARQASSLWAQHVHPMLQNSAPVIGGAAVSEYAKEAKLIFPIALDLNGTEKPAYRIFGPPAAFFIERQGIIRDIVRGPITSERVKEASRSWHSALNAL